MSTKVVAHLKKIFQLRKQKNPSYSLRAFSKQLNTDHSMLSKILSEKRALSFELATKYLEALNTEEFLKNDLLLSFSNSSIFHEPKEWINFEPINAAESKILEKWYFPAVKSTLSITTVVANDHSIAEFLNIEPNQVNKCMKIHIKFGDVILKDSLYILKAHSSFRRNNISNQSRVNMIKNVIYHSIEKINPNEDETMPPAEYIGSIFSTSDKKIQEAQRKLVNFMSYLMQWLENEEDDIEKNTVYSLGMQLVPLGFKKKKSKNLL